MADSTLAGSTDAERTRSPLLGDPPVATPARASYASNLHIQTSPPPPLFVHLLMEAAAPSDAFAAGAVSTSTVKAEFFCDDAVEATAR
ncbi:hypothetical protein AB1Y20_013744 [Prymnesium parvum]|uniref:Uncharacterized protein n=1 Tax=Prymnesium parvum TaxID=97485 RepID=A0AB34IGF0_PRYPA